MIGASGRRGKYLTILRAIGDGLMHTSPYAPDPTLPAYLDPQGAWAGLGGVVQVIAERCLDGAHYVMSHFRHRLDTSTTFQRNRRQT